MENNEFTCSKCNKDYKSYYALWRHKKIKHGDDKDDEETANNVCKFCSKILSDRRSRWYHEKNTCKKNPEHKEKPDTNKSMNISTKTNTNTDTNIIKTNNSILPIDTTDAKQINITQNEQVTLIQNQTNNNNITNINITFNALGKEDVMELTESQREQIVNDGLNSLTTLIKYLNFNKDLPQNHTYCNTNLNNKYISTLNVDTKEIEKKRKIDFFDKVLICSLAHLKSINKYISDVIKQDEFEKKISQIESYILFQPEQRKLYIEEINAITYNKRKDIQNTWNKMLIE